MCTDPFGFYMEGPRKETGFLPYLALLCIKMSIILSCISYFQVSVTIVPHSHDHATTINVYFIICSMQMEESKFVKATTMTSLLFTEP